MSTEVNTENMGPPPIVTLLSKVDNMKEIFSFTFRFMGSRMITTIITGVAIISFLILVL